jgi:hypothetical protein
MQKASELLNLIQNTPGTQPAIACLEMIEVYTQHVRGRMEDDSISKVHAKLKDSDYTRLKVDIDYRKDAVLRLCHTEHDFSDILVLGSRLGLYDYSVITMTKSLIVLDDFRALPMVVY